MEPTTWLILIAAALVAIGIIALAARVFLKLLKLLIFVVIIVVIGGFVWTQFKPEQTPTQPAVSPTPRSRPAR